MEQKSNWLAIASFVLALIGALLCLSIIWSVFWIICLVLSFIFWIIALVKKQTPWAARIGTILSWISLVIGIIFIVFWWLFVARHSDTLISPVTEFSNFIKENPEYAKLMKDEQFSEKFEEILEQRMTEKYWEDYKNIDNLDWALEAYNTMFEEMKSIITELALQEWVGLSNGQLPTSEIIDLNNEDEKDNNELNIQDNSAWLANPASTYCEENGGTLVLETNEEWQYWVCVFENGNSCEERAFYRGECSAE